MNKNKLIFCEILFALSLILIFSFNNESINYITSTILFFVFIPIIKVTASCAYILMTFNNKDTLKLIEDKRKKFIGFSLLPKPIQLFLLSLQIILFYTILSNGFVFIAYYILISYVAYVGVTRTFATKINNYFLIKAK